MKWLIDLLSRFAGPIILFFVVLLVVVIAVMAWQGSSRRAAGQEAARAKGGQVVAAAGDKASSIATEAVAAQGEKELAVAATDQENRHEVLSQPDAGVGAGAAGDAGLRGLCRRPVYRDHPRCAGLRRADSAAAPR